MGTIFYSPNIILKMVLEINNFNQIFNMISIFIIGIFIFFLMGCKSNERYSNKLIIRATNSYISDTIIFKIIDNGNIIENGNGSKIVFLIK